MRDIKRSKIFRNDAHEGPWHFLKLIHQPILTILEFLRNDFNFCNSLLKSLFKTLTDTGENSKLRYSLYCTGEYVQKGTQLKLA